MKYGLLLLMALALPGLVQAQSFAVSELSPLFVDGADVVVRLDETTFEVSGPGRAVERRRFVATIFKPTGQEAGTMGVSYDQFRRFKKLDGRLLDASGKQIRKLGGRDVSDYSATSSFSLYDDNRVRVGTLRHDVYPYTVDFTYEREHRGLLSWPTWYPQRRTVPVERAVFRLTTPASVGARYRLQNFDVEPVRTENRGRETYEWSVAMLPGWDPEPFSPDRSEHLPAVWTAPTQFEIDGYKGQAATWEDFGRFYATLSEDRQQLPADAKADVQRLTADLADPREKVRVLYHYLQRRTRYVSVQLGIGGWQPFDAQYVHARGYGDCKALTNYMQALLAEAGIASYPALIRAGRFEPPVLEDFPSNQFNHAILYVPLDGDTLWLETTSQTSAFAHLGSFTEDRHALVVHPQGSFLARTPSPEAAANWQHEAAQIRLIGTGSAEGHFEMRFAGEGKSQVIDALHGQAARERTAWLRNRIQVPSFDVQTADYSSADAREDTVRLSVALAMPRYASLTGSRMFVPINPIAGRIPVPEARQEPRTQPVVFAAYPFHDEAVVDFVLPTGFGIEAIPEPVVLEMPFGRYEAAAELTEAGTLRYRRRFEINQTRLPAEAYDSLREFLQQVARADRAQAVLKQE